MASADIWKLYHREIIYRNLNMIIIKLCSLIIISRRQRFIKRQCPFWEQQLYQRKRKVLMCCLH